MTQKLSKVIFSNKEVIKYIKNETNISDKDISIVLETLAECIMINVSKNKDVFIKGIGFFSTALTKPRQIRDINTGNKFYINGRRVIKYRTIGKIKEYLINNFTENSNDI